MQITLTLNGIKVTEDVAADMLLIDFVRAHGCKSVKRGCETSNCGLCTVFLDEKPVLSCSVLAARASGHSITTLEGLQEEAAEFGGFIADQGAEHIDGGNARADIVFRIHPGNRIDGGAVDVHSLFREDFSQPVDGMSGSVKGAAQNFLGQGKLHGPADQMGAGVAQRNGMGALEYLNDHPPALDLHNSALAPGAVIQMDLHHLFIGSVVHIVQHDEGTVDFFYANVIKNHSFMFLSGYRAYAFAPAGIGSAAPVFAALGSNRVAMEVSISLI